jgi:hypothetical protein
VFHALTNRTREIRSQNLREIDQIAQAKPELEPPAASIVRICAMITSEPHCTSGIYNYAEYYLRIPRFFRNDSFDAIPFFHRNYVTNSAMIITRRSFFHIYICRISNSSYVRIQSRRSTIGLSRIAVVKMLNDFQTLLVVLNRLAVCKTSPES